jgi:hypothetical protein
LPAVTVSVSCVRPCSRAWRDDALDQRGADAAARALGRHVHAEHVTLVADLRAHVDVDAAQAGELAAVERAEHRRRAGARRRSRGGARACRPAARLPRRRST